MSNRGQNQSSETVVIVTGKERKMKAGRMTVAMAGDGQGVCALEVRAKIEDTTVFSCGFELHSLSSFFKAKCA